MRPDAEPQDLDAADGRLIVARVRPRIRDSRLSGAVGAVALLVGLAILKPWGVGAPSPSRAPRLATPSAVAVTPEPTADVSAEGLASPICLGAGGWRVVSLETWRTQDVRVWRAIEPAPAATGPLDPEIPSVPIVAVELTALGWCAPAYGPAKPVGPATVTAWWVDEGVATALLLEQLQPAVGVTPIAALYRPLGGCPTNLRCAAPLASPASPGGAAASPPRPEHGAWTTGRVVFHWVDEGAGTEAWLAADIAIIDAAPVP
jgi:hypothetical protein